MPDDGKQQNLAYSQPQYSPGANPHNDGSDNPPGLAPAQDTGQADGGGSGTAGSSGGVAAEVLEAEGGAHSAARPNPPGGHPVNEPPKGGVVPAKAASSRDRK